MRQQKQQKQQHPFSPKQTQILHMASIPDVAQLISEVQNHQNCQKMISYLKQMDHHQSKWEATRLQLVTMMVTHPQPLYISNHFLTYDKLLLVRDIIKQQKCLQQKYFSNQNGFLLFAATQGFLLQQPSVDQISKIKQYFMKSLKKQPSYWLLSHLQSMQSNVSDSSTGYMPSFNHLQHKIQVSRIQYFFKFILTYQNLFPQNLQIMSIFFKMMLCLRQEHQQDKKLLKQMKTFYFQGRYHFQITMKNIKFTIQFLRNSFNEKQSLYQPQKVLVNLLTQYSQQHIQNLLDTCWLGLNWTSNTIHNYFIACIKFGITQNIVKMMIAMINFCTKHFKYSQLLCTFQNNIARLFIFLKFPKFYSHTQNLLKHFILSPGPQISLYQKFTEKTISLVQNINPQICTPFMKLVQIVAYMFRQTTTVTELTNIYEVYVKQQNRQSEESMKKEIQKYSWKTNVKNKAVNSIVQRPGYRGLVNIGNSCYMNSFLQSLFMNRQFSRSILALSTLQLQKQRLKLSENENKDPSALIKLFRQDLRPLAQLQRIFALLQTSKRTQINPNPIKKIAPKAFQNQHQQDSIEFGRLFLEQLYKNKIPKLFEGQMTTLITCQSCKSTRQRKQPFLDLMLTPLQQQEEMESLLSTIFSCQNIEGLQCDNCGQKKGNSIKTHKISQIPNYLIVTFNRFQYSVTQKKNHKIMSKINNFQSITLNQDIFQLYSIIIHRGPSPHAGHYFTFSKYSYEVQAKWICHNDTEVNELESYKEVKSFMDTNDGDTPYILFYQRKNHISDKKQELMKPIVLRKPLEDYVNKDNLEEVKSKQKKILPLFNPFQLPFFKKDDDDEEGGQHNPSFYNNYIL